MSPYSVANFVVCFRDDIENTISSPRAFFPNLIENLTSSHCSKNPITRICDETLKHTLLISTTTSTKLALKSYLAQVETCTDMSLLRSSGMAAVILAVNSFHELYRHIMNVFTLSTISRGISKSD
jgi:hypothetical protein